ncbi:hypothetical protein JW926_15485 [Candidatus Sumerlaeota bacterium]|nr:hypothetical protein [Candidatus Sumerlaeota bacterium]
MNGNKPLSIASPSQTQSFFNIFWIKCRLLWSKARRLYLCLFRMDYVKDSIARRRGECKRCGACCRLFLKCHRLQMEDGKAHCAAYNKFRFPNCHMFPIDKRDLADRDLVSPDNPCGYWWDS